MPETCGVSWSGTSSGKLTESAIPDPPDHKSHYLNAADTKGDSSFPVVDGDGNLRAGNVNSAWDLRNSGDGVSEECLRKLAAAFDSNPLPESATENSTTVTPMNEDDTFGINVEFSSPAMEALGDGFNKYGVRENDDGSLDVRFNVMEPGVRRGYEITPEFLQRAASKDYDRIPVQLDHSDSQRANVGYIEPKNIKFADGFARAQMHIPNTGSSVKEDVIADFTHEPPAINDASVSFDPKSIEVEAPKGSDDNPKFVDGRYREVSLTPFPAGYDNGGLTPAFSDAIENSFSDPEDAETDDTSAESQLVVKQHKTK